MIAASTATSPNEGVTSGSLSIQHSGSALRYACAEARAIYLDAAAQRLGVAARQPRGAGRHHRRARATCARATGSWPTRACSSATRRPRSRPSPPSARRLAGTAAGRLDIPDKVFGRPRFVHDLVLPGMLHARVLRPPSPGATLTALDEAAAKAMPGVVAVVRDGSFVGVVAETEEAALARPEAAGAPARPGSRASRCPTRRTCGPGSRASRSRPPPSTCARLRVAGTKARTVRREYSRPYHCACLDGARRAPSRNGPTRGCTCGRTPRASTICAPTWRSCSALPAESIVVEHAEGAGCYGQNGADDVALEAALLARAVKGRPVQPYCGRARTRWPGRRWAPPGSSTSRPTSTTRARSSPGATTCGATGTCRARAAARRRPCRPPGSSPSRSRAWWRPTRRWPAAAGRSATPRRSTTSRPGASPTTACSPCRSAPPRCARSAPSPTCSPSSCSWTSWRPSAARTRVAFRLRHLKDPRARAVIEAAARRAGWSALDRSATAPATASASPATRVPAPIARWSPRWRARPKSACAGSCWPWTWAR